jgi:hypothetical protein
MLQCQDRVCGIEGSHVANDDSVDFGRGTEFFGFCSCLWNVVGDFSSTLCKRLLRDNAKIVDLEIVGKEVESYNL